MIRRLYLGNIGAPSFDPGSTLKGTWTDTTNAGNSGGLMRVPTGASTNSGFIDSVVTNPLDALIAHWTSHALPQNMKLTGTVQWVIMNLEDTAVADFVTKCHIWVTVGATTAVRGTLLNNFIGTTEWTLTTPTAMTDGVQTLTDVDAQAGDHIAIEFGLRATNADATSYTAALYYGGTTTPDTLVGVTTTGRPKWVEFSNDFWDTKGFKNAGIRPRSFAPGLGR